MCFPATTIGGGMNTMTAPDVCLTPAPPAPPIPVPYPNMNSVSASMPPSASIKVLINNANAVHLQTKEMMSNGDEPGVNGGVASGRFKGPIKYLKSSMKVTYQGKPAIFQTCNTGHNGDSPNTVGLNAVPSQPKVLICS